MAQCSINGCQKKHYARGVCEMHYKRWKLTGTTESGYKAHRPLEERFWSKVQKSDADDGCWWWVGARNKKGYGIIQEGGKGSPNLSAHRLSYKLHHGEIPEGLNVLHSCDNPSCVNPAHLRTGTQSENIAEAFGKKRKVNPVAFGEDNPRSKLTLEQVNFIKAHPEMQHVELAKMFGLSPNCIRGVRIGRTWK